VRKLDPNPGAKRHWKRSVETWPRLVRLAAVALLLLAGIAGLIMPVLPGWIFFGLALAVLTTLSPGLSRAWRRYLRTHPRLRGVLRRKRPRRA
jgi:uncharacterized membrane protein YbaN (DUF454 family)